MDKSISLNNLEKIIKDNNSKIIENTIPKIDELKSVVDDINLRSMIGEEHDYGYFNIETVFSSGNNMIYPFKDDNVKGMTSNNGYINLKKGKTYHIVCRMDITNISNWIQYAIFEDVTNSQISRPAYTLSVGNNSYTSSGFIILIYTANNDCNIYVKQIGQGGTTNIYANSTLSIHEIGRSYMVDPLDVKDSHVIESICLTQEIDSKQDINLNDYIKFDRLLYSNIKNKISYDISKRSFKLQKGQYRITCQLYLVSTSAACTYAIKNITDNITVPGTNAMAMSTNYNDARLSTNIDHIININKETEFSIFINNIIGGTPTVYGNGYSKLVITEISQPVVVEYNKYNEIKNPLTTGETSQESPVGSVISYMGFEAPEHYLKCDGSIYNINDYPHLANHFKDKLGSYNYFGGDGITTFAVPDWRGEFVRGYDPDNIRDPQGSTREFGKHQNGTYIPRVNVSSNGNIESGQIGTYNSNSDKNIVQSTKNVRYTSTSNFNSPVNIIGHYIARPTNVNTLFCIKYEPTFIGINQYGGFCSEVLFEGSANLSNTIYSLADHINNYDFILVHGRTYNGGSGGFINRTSLFIPVLDVKYEDSMLSSYVLSYVNPNDSFGYKISFSFIDKLSFKTFYISTTKPSTETYSIYSEIYKITGYKGSIPTLLGGGEL